MALARLEMKPSTSSARYLVAVSHARYTRPVSTEEILVAALALPEADRRLLLQRLADSLPEDVYDDPAFQAELDRREAEIEAGTAKLIPGEVVFAELHAKLAKMRAAG